MAVQSINTLQNSDNYNNIAKEYILESLANLGQRYNIKGDSISIDNMTIADLFTFTSEDNKEDYIVTVEKTNEQYNIYLVGKDDLSLVIYPEQTLSTGINKVAFDSFYLSNNVSMQYSGVNFSVNDFYYSFYGRSDSNAALNKTYWFAERYNKKNDNLEAGIRVFKSSISALQDNYLLVYVKLNQNFNYDVSVYIPKVNVSADNDEFIYNLLKNINFDTLSFSDVLFAYQGTYECEYDNFRIKPTQEVFEAILGEDYENKPKDQDIIENQILYSFTIDYKNLYPTLKEKYSASEYGSINSIQVKLLAKIYDEIVKTDGINTNKIYIPLLDKEGKPYSITYTYNVNKPEEVYFAGKELEVRYVSANITDNWMKNNIDDYRGSIIAHTEKCDKVTFFYFESQLSNGNIIDIDAKKISTLPYIDDNNYWVINDVSTGIRAKGLDAGNPNIIIVETNGNNGQHTIVSGARKDELLEALTWTNHFAKVEPLEKINLDNLSFKNEFDYFVVNCAIPDLDAISNVNRIDYLSQLENAIIICITPVSLISYDNDNSTDNINYTKDDVIRIYGEYGIITTIWTINDDNKFDYLRKRGNVYAAADFNYLSNINNLIQYAVKNTEPLHPDNFEFTRLVFDPTTATLKNNTKEYITYLYPNLINKLSSQYNISNYNNDLNFTLKYNDTVIKSNNERNIESVTQSGELRYLKTNNIDNSANIVTNSLYSYYDGNTNAKYNEFIPNYNVPTFDLGEVLTRNETLLNRLNILSLDSVGTSYLSYIGSSVNSEKNILTIGTTDTNINMGTDTMINSTDRGLFNKQTELNVDFPQTNINGDVLVKDNLEVGTDIYINRALWSKDYNHIKTSAQISDITYYTTIYTPVSRYLYELNDKYSTKNAVGMFNVIPEEIMQQWDDVNSINFAGGSGNEIKTSNDKLLKGLLELGFYNYAVNRNKLYTITSLAEYYQTTQIDAGIVDVSNVKGHMIYFSDGIYLPALLSQVGLTDYVNTNGNYINTKNVKLTSNMEIITVNESPLVLLSSSTNLYPDNYIYGRTADNNTFEQIANFTYSVFTANPMKITYYVQGSKLNIHIEELYGKNKFAINKKIRYNYTV